VIEVDRIVVTEGRFFPERFVIFVLSFRGRYVFRFSCCDDEEDLYRTGTLWTSN
jgi:hypothetical protein